MYPMDCNCTERLVLVFDYLKVWSTIEPIIMLGCLSLQVISMCDSWVPRILRTLCVCEWWEQSDSIKEFSGQVRVRIWACLHYLTPLTILALNHSLAIYSNLNVMRDFIGIRHQNFRRAISIRQFTPYPRISFSGHVSLIGALRVLLLERFPRDKEVVEALEERWQAKIMKRYDSSSSRDIELFCLVDNRFNTKNIERKYWERVQLKVTFGFGGFR